MKKIYAIELLYFSILYQYVQSTVHVNTKLGNIKGTTRLSRDGKRFNAFLGVPYAQPPIEDLRFEKPVPVKPWNTTLDATSYPSICPQMSPKGFIGHEDCLYLNIYTPQMQHDEKLPVWVFIYGGRRLMGNGLPYKYGPEYIMDKPVILVLIAYRIGPVGYFMDGEEGVRSFLSTEDTAIPGNYGLKDQVMALRWIQENVEAFGGDSTNVTLAGGSSGASDVSLHLFSDRSEGLFHRCISQSGQLLNFWTLQPPGKGRERAWQFAKAVQCDVKTSEKLLQCLKSKPIETLIYGTFSLMYDYLLPDSMFGPVIEHKYVDEAFLTDNPAELIKKPKHIPWILGVTSDEGALGSVVLFSNRKAVRHFDKNYRKIFPEFFGYELSSNFENITEILVSKYLKHRSISTSFHSFGKIFGFSHAYVGAIETTLRYNGPKYFYFYDYKNRPDFIRNYGIVTHGEKVGGMYVKHDTGPIHGEELMSMFNYPYLFPPIVRGDDRVVSDQVLSLWYNFVVSGDPNRGNQQIWKPVTTENLEYLHIGNMTFAMKDKLLWDEYKFWKGLDTSVLITSETHKPLWTIS